MDKLELYEKRVYSDPSLPIDAFAIGGRGYLISAHWHPDLEILYVESGSVVFTVDGDRVVAEAGTAVVANVGELHTAESSGTGPARFHAIVFDPRLLSSPAPDAFTSLYLDPLREGDLSLPRRIPGDTPAERDALRICRDLVERLKDRPPGYVPRVKSLLFGWLADLVEEDLLTGPQGREAGDAAQGRRAIRSGSRFESIKAALSVLQDRYDAPLSVSELATAANLSEFHFYRVFREATGRSPIEYLNEYRCRRAAQLLRNTDAGVLGIALDVGFSSSAYFIRVFRRHYGCTPSRYRSGNRTGIRSRFDW